MSSVSFSLAKRFNIEARSIGLCICTVLSYSPLGLLASLSCWAPIRSEMKYVERVLQPGETIQYRSTIHWIVYLHSLVLFTVGAIGLAVLLGANPIGNEVCRACPSAWRNDSISKHDPLDCVSAQSCLIHRWGYWPRCPAGRQSDRK